MNKTTLKNFVLRFVCVALIAAMSFSVVGCKNKQTEAPSAQDDVKVTVLGEGETEFMLDVTDGEGKTEKFEIHTDKKTVGDALIELSLLEGDMGDYGLYVKKVNGITADYDKDGTYWAFYINGEYAMTGVDLTDITEGASYALKVEK